MKFDATSNDSFAFGPAIRLTLFLSLIFPIAAQAGENSDDGTILPISQQASRSVGEIEGPSAIIALLLTSATPSQGRAVKALERALKRANNMYTFEDQRKALDELRPQLDKVSDELYYLRKNPSADPLTIAAKVKEQRRLATKWDNLIIKTPDLAEDKLAAIKETEAALKEVKAAYQAELLRPIGVRKLASPSVKTAEGIKALKSAKAIKTLTVVAELGFLADALLRAEEVTRKESDKKAPVSAIPLFSEPNQLYRHVSASQGFVSEPTH